MHSLTHSLTKSDFKNSRQGVSIPYTGIPGEPLSSFKLLKDPIYGPQKKEKKMVSQFGSNGRRLWRQAYLVKT